MFLVILEDGFFLAFTPMSAVFAHLNYKLRDSLSFVSKFLSGWKVSLAKSLQKHKKAAADSVSGYYSAPQKPDNSNKQQSINLELRNVQLWQSYLDAFTTHNSKQKLS